MHETQQKIISLFRKSSKELSTSQILESIDNSYTELKKQLDSGSKDKIKLTRDKIAQLHRKILHHINKLTDADILRIVKHGEKGEKFFSLNLEDNEELISIDLKKRAIIPSPSVPIMPIEGYEQKGIVTKYEPATWIDKLNSVVIRCEKIGSLKELTKILNEKVFSCINDAVCLENFQALLNKEHALEFLERISEDSENYGKKVSIVITLSEIKNLQNFEEFLSSVKKNIFLIFNVRSQDLQEHFKLLSRIVEIYSKKKNELYFKNKTLHPSPYFLGRAGPYSIGEKDWLSADIKEHICVACCQSSLIVDVNKFTSLYSLDTEKFTELILNISKSILSANSLQRRKSEEYFKNIIQLNNKKDVLSVPRNYIRFWNYGLSQKDIDPELVINMISESKKKIDSFSRAEEIIYNSCGMPSRFSLAFSCAFKGSDEKLSEAKYSALEIKNFEDLYRKNVKAKVKDREIISEIFDGGNSVTFHRSGSMTPEEVIREISIIFNSYNLPFFSYNFENVKGDLKITNFFK